MDFLSGYKTYVVGAVLVLVGVLGIFGVAVPGFEGDAGLMIANGLGMIFLRSGVKSVAK